MTFLVLLYELIDRVISVQPFADPISRLLAEAKHHTHAQSFDNRLMERPAQFRKLSKAIVNVFPSCRAHENDIAGWDIPRFKIQLAQQIPNSRLHARSTWRITSPNFISIGRPIISRFVQHLLGVPLHRVGSLLFWRATRI